MEKAKHSIEPSDTIKLIQETKKELPPILEGNFSNTSIGPDHFLGYRKKSITPIKKGVVEILYVRDIATRDILALDITKKLLLEKEIRILFQENGDPLLYSPDPEQDFLVVNKDIVKKWTAKYWEYDKAVSFWTGGILANNESVFYDDDFQPIENELYGDTYYPIHFSKSRSACIYSNSEGDFYDTIHLYDEDVKDSYGTEYAWVDCTADKLVKIFDNEFYRLTSTIGESIYQHIENSNIVKDI